MQLEDSLKKGIIETIKAKQESVPVVKQITAMNRTVGGTARPSHHLRGASVPQPRTAISKHAMDFVHDYGLASPTSTLPPEIALREPLDKEFSLNRKMAKKHF